MISLSGVVPMEALTSLVMEHTLQDSELSESLGDLTVGDVSSNFH